MVHIIKLLKNRDSRNMMSVSLEDVQGRTAGAGFGTPI